ncbi:hypothetical protein CQW23_02953 [Capsicum baccatum]|uniref:Protein FAR1-RELATED SEQUENCE n=1 Tax=Capsicum baccatum TaxID=33114 RepID=A0A2G2XSZ6_CAPBA|nr:hypothetical protein CQW23_02953 [Capsicum baccatum]
MHDDSYTEEQYTTDLVEGMCFRCVKSVFTFYKEQSRLTDFGVVKKSTKKEAGQLKYVTFGCDRCQKTTARNQSKRVDCKARVNCRVMNDGSCIVTKIILEHNHELEPALPDFFPCHKKLRRTVKRSLVAYDIAGLRPSKSIRLLEVEAGGPERMRTWLTAMGEIPSTAILIDQCESIKAAIGEMLPNTIHRNDEVNHINSKKKFIVVAVVEDMKPTEESSDDVKRDTKQVFKAMAELDEQMRRSQDRLEFMIIRINATEERFKVIRKEIFDQYRKDQANFLQLKQHRHILCS